MNTMYGVYYQKSLYGLPQFYVGYESKEEAIREANAYHNSYPDYEVTVRIYRDDFRNYSERCSWLLRGTFRKDALIQGLSGLINSLPSDYL